jgi:phytanoyl-CoA hydroxylase
MSQTSHLTPRFKSSRPILTPEQRQSWEDNGFLMLKSFFDKKQVEVINELIDSLWINRKTSGTPLVCDAFIETPQEKRIRLKDAPDEARHLPYKLNDLYLEKDAIRSLILDPRLSNILSNLLAGKPLAFNTLNFERGSQQRFHFDTFYMPPRIPNKMLATWIALEPGSEKSGPLRYYPGSHKIPPYSFSSGRLNAIADEMPLFDEYINAQLKEFNLTPTVFYPEAGDVFIWHAQLYHGGSPILDPSATRKSIVTHYFRARDYILRKGWRFRKSGGGYYLRKPHSPVGK